VFYLGDYIESPIYSCGEPQSHCNGTLSSGGYEIVGSVTAREFIAGTWKETLGVTSNIAKHSIWDSDYIGPK